MASSPTQRTLAYLRKQGKRCAVVETWNAFAKRRVDAFGFVDLLAIDGDGITAVQCTSGTNHAARRSKILASADARAWAEAGGRIEVISWSKRKLRRGGAAVRWVPRVEAIGPDEFGEGPGNRILGT